MQTEFKQGLGLFDAAMIVAGAMIGSGIFIVSADMARRLGSPWWLLAAWLITGALTMAAALAYGELAALLPHVGGQYVYLREAYSPLWGFLYGWTLLLVIQSGSIAAVAVAFARFAGVFFPAIAENSYLIEPVHLSANYAVSLSTAQLVAVVMIAVLTITNMRGLEYGRLVQNLFTVAKTGALVALIVVGLTLGWNAPAVERNFGGFFTISGAEAVDDQLSALSALGLLVALCVAQTGSLFSADSWHNVTMVAPEVRDPQRNLPRALALGTGLVIVLYVLANFAYLATLPFAEIQHADADRVGTAMLERIFPGLGVGVMSGAIMVSTFGCNNSLILAGARTCYAMARDGLFFPPAGRLNAARVPAWSLGLLGAWSAVLVLPRTYDLDKESYGNLYSNLLDYVVSAALLFYVVTIIGLFRLRRTRPDAPRPYRAWGYPWVPALYVVLATTIVVVLFVYRSETSLPGLVIVGLGIPVYAVLKRRLPAGRGHAGANGAGNS